MKKWVFIAGDTSTTWSSVKYRKLGITSLIANCPIMSYVMGIIIADIVIAGWISLIAFSDPIISDPRYVILKILGLFQESTSTLINIFKMQ